MQSVFVSFFLCLFIYLFRYLYWHGLMNESTALATFACKRKPLTAYFHLNRNAYYTWANSKRIGICIQDRIYLNRCTSFLDVSLWCCKTTCVLCVCAWPWVSRGGFRGRGQGTLAPAPAGEYPHFLVYFRLPFLRPNLLGAKGRWDIHNCAYISFVAIPRHMLGVDH